MHSALKLEISTIVIVCLNVGYDSGIGKISKMSLRSLPHTRCFVVQQLILALITARLPVSSLPFFLIVNLSRPFTWYKKEEENEKEAKSIFYTLEKRLNTVDRTALKSLYTGQQKIIFLVIKIENQLPSQFHISNGCENTAHLQTVEKEK